MQKRKQEKAAKKQAAGISLTGKLAALCIPVIVAALMLVSPHFINTKMIKQNSAGSTYEVRDFALFVAMPLLNAALK